jgi:hypothetical protein
MKKTDKKIDNAIIKGLHAACEIALDEVDGFKWITHLVRYNDFPRSLSIVCIFGTNSDLAGSHGAQSKEYLRKLVNDQLKATGVNIRDIGPRVRFDTEENCRDENGGRWHERLA